MINLENFKVHLETISQYDWKRLFELLSEIEKTEMFGEVVINEKDGIFNLPYYDWSEIASRFVKVSYDLKIVPAFDWVNWEEGKKVLENDSEVSFENFDNVTLCKLIATIIRADRFIEGYLISNFENKTIYKILQSLKNKIHDR